MWKDHHKLMFYFFNTMSPFLKLFLFWLDVMFQRNLHTYIELLLVSLMQSHIKTIESFSATSGGLIFQTFRNVPDGVN